MVHIIRRIMQSIRGYFWFNRFVLTRQTIRYTLVRRSLSWSFRIRLRILRVGREECNRIFSRISLLHKVVDIVLQIVTTIRSNFRCFVRVLRRRRSRSRNLMTPVISLPPILWALLLLRCNVARVLRTKTNIGRILRICCKECQRVFSRITLLDEILNIIGRIMQTIWSYFWLNGFVLCRSFRLQHRTFRQRNVTENTRRHKDFTKDVCTNTISKESSFPQEFLLRGFLCINNRLAVFRRNTVIIWNIQTDDITKIIILNVGFITDTRTWILPLFGWNSRNPYTTTILFHLLNLTKSTCKKNLTNLFNSASTKEITKTATNDRTLVTQNIFHFGIIFVCSWGISTVIKSVGLILNRINIIAHGLCSSRAFI